MRLDRSKDMSVHVSRLATVTISMRNATGVEVVELIRGIFLCPSRRKHE
jgi:hypothetical protein